MQQLETIGRLEHLTFKANMKQTRYGWLRLTPAYSVHLVAELLEKHWQPGGVVLDPYCGTGTTALVCSERGIDSDTTDINPFLIWLARAKAAAYAPGTLQEFRMRAAHVGKAMSRANGTAPWIPPIHQIEKWWSDGLLQALGRAMGAIHDLERTTDSAVVDLLKVAFCRTMIDHANVSFGHQSMSFKKPTRALSLPLDEDEYATLAESWNRNALTIANAAKTPIGKPPGVIKCDARDLRVSLKTSRYQCVITSPPYPNRMSYIRELRPYMYWLGYLKDGREAGELDWQAIGGTWGCATSNVGKWVAERDLPIPYAEFPKILAGIGERSRLLANYVAKYFYDMVHHCESLFAVTAPGGTIHYIVGNSKFYDTMLPVEHIFASIFASVGFVDTKVETIRKRSSKKELFEFVVSARKPS